MNPNCPTIRRDYATLLSLKERFQIELKKAAVSGDCSVLDTLKTDIEATKGRLDEAIGRVSLEKAKELFTHNFFGPEAIETTFGFAIDKKDIPPVPFSKKELETAKNLGQMLVLQVDALPDGAPITGKLIHERFGKQQDGNNFLYDTDWYANEDFFTKEIPRKGWVLVCRETIPESKGTTDASNYLGQTDTLVAYIENNILPTLPPAKQEAYEKAIEAYKDKKSDIEKLWEDYDINWKEIARILSELEITKLSRDSVVEIWYRMKLGNSVKGAREENIFQSEYSWSRSRSLGGYLVFVGYFESDGAHVARHDPRDRGVALGVAFSRRKL